MFRQFMTLLAGLLFSVSSLGQTSAVDQSSVTAQDILGAFQSHLENLSPEERAMYDKSMSEIGKLTEAAGPLHKMSTNSKTNTRHRAFVCAGGQIGMILLSGTKLACVSHQGQVFIISMVGFDISLVVSGNVAVGYSTGPIDPGIYDLSFKAGFYKLAGATVLSGGNINLIAVGVGYGGHLSFGVPADSLFGGQLVIE